MRNYGFTTAEQALAHLIDGVGGLGVIRLDTEARICGWNEGAKLITGHKRAEAEGRAIDFIFTPEDRDAGVVEFELETARREGSAVDERWHMRKDGTRFWGRGLTLALRDGDGRFLGWAKLFRDDTIRHRTQQALERRCRSLDERAYHLVHDLRAPFRQISLVLDLIERRLGRQLDERERSLLEHARAAAHHGLEFVTKWADAQRAEQTKEVETGEAVALDRAWHDTARIFDVAAAILQPELEDSGSSVSRRGLPQVYADATGLLRVFQNLVSNALRHARGKPVSVVACAEPMHEDDGERVWRFTVQDNGPGIPRERRAGLFQRGVGAGLAICRKVVEAHGGRIWVDPDTASGAAIHFTIPTEEPPELPERADGGARR